MQGLRKVAHTISIFCSSRDKTTELNIHAIIENNGVYEDKSLNIIHIKLMLENSTSCIDYYICCTKGYFFRIFK